MTNPRRVDALVAAEQTLTTLGIDQSRPVDPFAAIEALGLDLVIADLDNLLGAVLPHGHGGVMVTSERGAGVQRYTAAHEIGHWILHQNQLRLDGPTEILGRPTDELERQAQLFAAYFLMPPPLMEAAIDRHGLRRFGSEPERVYLISRDLQVSYEAAARRLANMGLLHDADLTSLLKVGRLAAMRRAFGGRRPLRGASDLWSAGAALDQMHLPVREGDDVLVTLPENRTTGWQWLDDDAIDELRNADRSPRARPVPPSKSVTSQTNSRDTAPDGIDAHLSPATVRAALELVPTSKAPAAVHNIARDDTPLRVIADDFTLGGDDAARPRSLERRRREIAGSAHSDAVPLADIRIGATGQRTLAVHCAEPGSWILRLRYAHAHDPESAPAAQYELHLDVDPTPTHAYRLRRLAADLDAQVPGDPGDYETFAVTAE
jgi:predicted secreted protein